MSTKLVYNTLTFSPFMITYAYTWSLYFSRASSFAFFSRSCLLFSFLITFYFSASILSYSAYLIASYLALIVYLWSFCVSWIPSITTVWVPSVIALSSSRKLNILSISHGTTYSCIDRSLAGTNTPCEHNYFIASSLNPMSQSLAIIRALTFWWAYLFYSFLALFYNFLL